MYNSGYSQASFGLAAKKIRKPTGKSCGYYMKIIFFFSSLIQSLIIVSLVLFLVYGQPEESAAEKRLQDLEQSFGKLSVENTLLREQKSNLTQLLNTTRTENLRKDKDLHDLRNLSSISGGYIKILHSKASQCEKEKITCLAEYAKLSTEPNKCRPNVDQSCHSLSKQLENVLNHVKANFSQTVKVMKIGMENSNKARDDCRLDAIELRRDKKFLQDELELYRKKCKEDFVTSLQGIPNVTREFLAKIDTLFPRLIPFQLTCERQHEHLEDIRKNCSSLSREVEDKFQHYLVTVATQVSEVVAASSKYKVQNERLVEDREWCRRNRSAMAEENSRLSGEAQLRHDREVEQLLFEQMKLRGDKKLQDSALKLKDDKISILSDRIQSLNASLANCFLRVNAIWTSRSPFGTGGVVTGFRPTGQGPSGSITEHEKQGVTTVLGAKGKGRVIEPRLLVPPAIPSALSLHLKQLQLYSEGYSNPE